MSYLDMKALSELCDEINEAYVQDFERFEVREPNKWTDEYIKAVAQEMEIEGIRFVYITDGSIEFKQSDDIRW